MVGTFGRLRGAAPTSQSKGDRYGLTHLSAHVNLSRMSTIAGRQSVDDPALPIHDVQFAMRILPEGGHSDLLLEQLRARPFAVGLRIRLRKRPDRAAAIISVDVLAHQVRQQAPAINVAARDRAVSIAVIVLEDR